MALRGLNFNLIPVLRVLLRERSVTRAAESLGLTQSGVSAALGRLRAALDDELLVSVGRAMVLTPRALALIEPVERLCAGLEDLARPPRFEPARLVRNFVFETADFVALRVAARMIPALAERAPGVDLQFIEPAAQRLARLGLGEADFTIMPRFVLDSIDAAAVSSRPLLADHYVAVVGADHALAAIASPTQSDFDGQRHLVYHLGAEAWSASWRRQVSNEPEEARVVGRFQNLSMLPLLALETETVAVVPLSMAQLMSRWLPVRVLDMPGQRIDLDLTLVWSRAFDQDPAHRWLRNLLALEFGGTAEPQLHPAARPNAMSP